MERHSLAYVGVDIAKATLQVDAGDLFRGSIGNDAAAIGKALEAIGKRVGRGTGIRVCYESTGTYGRTLRETCGRLGVPTSTLNPMKVKRFHESGNRNQKTDPIDAAVIRRYAESWQPPEDPPPDRKRDDLRELVSFRTALADTLGALKGRLESLRPGSPAARLVAKESARVEKEIASLDARIAKAVKANPATKGLAKAVGEVAGIGPVTAATLVALLPELGRVPGNRIAPLVGLVPLARISGTSVLSPGHIGMGRPAVRHALWMPTLCAVTYHPDVRRFYAHLRDDLHKPYRVAMVACMRKFLLIVNLAAAKWYAGETAAQNQAD